MAKKINGKEYDAWSKDELIKEIVKIKSTTYGLVWHRDLPEEKIDILINPDARTPNEMFPNEMAGKPFPVLKEVRNKAIESDKSRLVNLLIEGDNYHSLAVLNFTHSEAVDLIYIDPPYNTGNNDFIYNDKFVDREDSFRHSKWLSFMEKRLKLAKFLLKQTGVIFISIDDNEQAPLKMLCDEIFGENNFIANYIWESRSGKGATAKLVANQHEYVLCYAKNVEFVKIKEDIREAKGGNFEDEKGKYRREQLRQWGQGDKREDRPTMYYEVIGPNSEKIFPIKDDDTEGRWRISNKSMLELINNNDVDFVSDGKRYQIYRKIREGKITKTAIGTFLFGLGTASTGTIELKEIFGEKIFDTTKPLNLVKYIIELASVPTDGTILDFFAGSGTTGHAVLELNKKDSADRNFILCTNNGDEKSKHRIASDVCYPRIQKVIKGFKSSEGKKIEGLGGNLKYYKTDFVEAEPTDKNKRKLVKESTDMLCILENAFELVQETPEFKIFKNTDKYVGVIFYEESIEDYKKVIKKIEGHFNTYVFSMGDDPHAKKFADVKGKVTLCAIPEVILKVYREIFK